MSFPTRSWPRARGSIGRWPGARPHSPGVQRAVCTIISPDWGWRGRESWSGGLAGHSGGHALGPWERGCPRSRPHVLWGGREASLSPVPPPWWQARQRLRGPPSEPSREVQTVGGPERGREGVRGAPCSAAALLCGGGRPGHGRRRPCAVPAEEEPERWSSVRELRDGAWAGGGRRRAGPGRPVRGTGRV